MSAAAITSIGQALIVGDARARLAHIGRDIAKFYGHRIFRSFWAERRAQMRGESGLFRGHRIWDQVSGVDRELPGPRGHGPRRSFAFARLYRRHQSRSGRRAIDHAVHERAFVQSCAAKFEPYGDRQVGQGDRSSGHEDKLHAKRARPDPHSTSGSSAKI
jgi:hypothetical protein